MTTKDSKLSGLTRRRLLTATAAGGGLLVAPRGIFTPAIAQTSAIKVGVLAPLSGVYASLGTNMMNGIKMVLNAKGMKAAGRPIQLIVEDTEAKPQEGLRKARKLVEEDNVVVLLGVISSAIGYAMKQYAGRTKKVWITTGAAADGIFKKANNNPYAFRASLSTWQANHPMGTWLNKKGYKRAFVAGPDYAMGHEALAAFAKTFEENGAKQVGGVYPKLGTTDFAPYLAEIKRANPDLVYASFAGSDAVRFVQQYHSFGLKESAQLAGYGYLVAEDTILAQSEAALGVYTSINWAYGLDTPMNKTFVADYRKAYNTAPTIDSVAGYVGAAVVWDAFNRLGGKGGSQEDLSKAVEATKIDTPRGPISFDPETHNVIQNMYIREAVKMDGAIHNKVLAKYDAIRDPGV